MDREISELLEASSLPRKEELIQSLRPGLYIRSSPIAAQAVSQGPAWVEALPASRPVGNERTASGAAAALALGLGASRIGGLPDLPPNFRWPRWQGRPLAFAAQFDLMQLPDFPDRHLLPEAGMLYFFYDYELEDWNEWGPIAPTGEPERYAVLYAPEELSLVAGSRPPGLDDSRILWPAALSFEVKESMPIFTHPIFDELGFSFDDQLAYMRVLWKMRRGETHQILGYPMPVQHSVVSHCQRQAGVEPDVDWELLFQFCLYHVPGVPSLDAAVLYYLIPRDALITQRFDATWFICQYS